MKTETLTIEVTINVTNSNGVTKDVPNKVFARIAINPAIVEKAQADVVGMEAEFLIEDIGTYMENHGRLPVYGGVGKRIEESEEHHWNALKNGLANVIKELLP